MGVLRPARVAAILATTATLMIGLAPRVSAHGADDTSNRSADYVRQCITYMVSTADLDMAHDKMHDAMDASDRSGVDIQDVELAHDAFHAGDMHHAQAYLEASIGVQPHISGVTPATVSTDAMAAVGAEPGTVFIDQPLDGVRTLSGVNLAALLLSILALVSGVVIALRTRPRHRTES